MAMSVPEISVYEAQELLAGPNPPRLIDVREEDEWELCRIEGAELIPLSLWATAAGEKLEDDEESLLIYCHHGARSASATAFLLNNGFSNVKNLAGGIDAWSLYIDSSVPRY
jgi:rhodanese-related sulfurtransferase